MRGTLRGLFAVGLAAGAVLALSGKPAWAGVIYEFRGGIAGGSGACLDPEVPCTVDGIMEVSQAAFRQGQVDDLADLTRFRFAIAPADGSGIELGRNDIANACAVLGDCLDIAIGPEGDSLMTGVLNARHLIPGILPGVPGSEEFGFELTGSNGLWSGQARSDAPPQGTYALSGVWTRIHDVPEPGTLSLLLVGLGAAGFAGRRLRRAR